MSLLQSESKICDEKGVKTYRRSLFENVAICRKINKKEA